ncbi:DUF2332 domain-containing protein [Methylocapsa sp. S129]|uniref:DUF2332 domain-containing protein n=1 Tax=Methylocapsa sp. S129 TaxID=1641869 RepID=UPI00131C2A9E|nr:DUF2332 family protein [Methylocapsa sp. S129]
MNPDALNNFRQQAEWCEQMGSPFTALVCGALHAYLTEETAFGRRLLNWPDRPEADAIALRACGALNALAREGHPALAPFYPPNRLPSDVAFWRAAQSAFASDDARLTRFLDSAPQTNEVARSAALLPGYLTIARLTGLPLAVREIGASAGLNLSFDRYFYRYGSFSWGTPDAKVTIPCEWRGERSAVAGAIEIADRQGCDLNPIDARDAAARARMLAYIWPDQTARVERAQAALDLASNENIRVEQIDAALFAARELSAGAPGRALVLAHSIFWQYLPDATKAAIRAAIAQAADRATKASPFAWLRMEAEADERRGARVRLSLWPQGPVDELLAVADFHGRWLEWRGVA